MAYISLSVFLELIYAELEVRRFFKNSGALKATRRYGKFTLRRTFLF